MTRVVDLRAVNPAFAVTRKQGYLSAAAQAPLVVLKQSSGRRLLL